MVNEGGAGMNMSMGGGGGGAFLTMVPEDVNERIELKSKEIHWLMECIVKLRTFYQFKISLLKEKYETEIKTLTRNNMDSETTYRQIQELQRKND
jgi:hypothetical protein